MAPQRLQWDMLADDTWAQIASHLDTRDKMNLERVCRQSNAFFKRPPTSEIWGRLEFTVPKTVDSSYIWRMGEWVQQRVAGISAICLRQTGGDMPAHYGTTKMWHALVASTSGTSIRLRLSDPATWQTDSAFTMRMLAAPLRTELLQRLTALDMCVGEAHDVAVVHSLAALRNLRLWTHSAARLMMFNPDIAGVNVAPCQLSNLRTLRLYQIWPEAFFLTGVDATGVAASLQQLHSLCIEECELVVDEEIALALLPNEVLRLPTLERLELVQLQLLFLPDMRGLPALRSLVISGEPHLRAVAGPALEGADELPAAAPFAGASGLTELCLINTPVNTQAAADAIARLPHLKVLRLDFSADEEVVFWATTLQRQLRGHCKVQPAAEYVATDWADDDW